MQLLPKQLSADEMYKLIIGCVIPRPIAWVSTMNKDGVANLAPFSFFTVVSTKPPMVGITSMVDKVNQKPKKDTLINIEETKEFVVNIADMNFAQELVKTSFSYPYGIDEFEKCHLTKIESEDVKAPRVKEAPVSMECKLHEVNAYGEDGSYFIIGEVVRFHVDDRIMFDDKKVDQYKFDAIGRLGGPLYASTKDIFQIKRPQ